MPCNAWVSSSCFLWIWRNKQTDESSNLLTKHCEMFSTPSGKYRMLFQAQRMHHSVWCLLPKFASHCVCGTGRLDGWSKASLRSLAGSWTNPSCCSAQGEKPSPWLQRETQNVVHFHLPRPDPARHAAVHQSQSQGHSQHWPRPRLRRPQPRPFFFYHESYELELHEGHQCESHNLLHWCHHHLWQNPRWHCYQQQTQVTQAQAALHFHPLHPLLALAHLVVWHLQNLNLS